MQTDPMTVITVAIMLSFLPILAFRVVLSCRNYLYTGKFGSVDDGGFFSLMNHFHMKNSSLYEPEDVPSFKEIIKNLFTGVHPATILMDGLVYTAVAMISAGITTLFANFPYLMGIPVTIGLFITLMRTMRKRIARKQEFIAKLEGTYDE